jgi:hypothetical protein
MARQPQERFRRKPAHKKPYKRIMIVCEDSVISVKYFKALCNDLRVTGAKVKVYGSAANGCGGNSPTQLLDYAIKAATGKLRGDNTYDHVYCVFDMEHPDSEKTLNNIRKNKKLTAIPSYPCFEIWPLLHFQKTSASFRNSSEVCKKLEKKIPSYNKATTQDLYPLLKEHTETALTNSDSIRREAKETDANIPTDIDILVRNLQTESKKK